MSLKNTLKSSYKESANTALDSISAIQTLLTNYPIAITTKIDDGVAFNSETFMFSILRTIGVSDDEIINWFTKLLSGKGSDGFLEKLELVVKGILIANIKNMLTCSMNPLLPDKVMHYADVGRQINGYGIKINISDIDLFGLLQHSPLSEKNGSVFYFDALEPIYNDERYNGGDKPNIEPYSPNHLWASCDFNAYLWYIIHRNPSKDRNRYWDNRCRHISTLAKDNTLREKFFDFGNQEIDTDIHTREQVVDNKIKRYEIVRCEFEEGDSNTLTVFVNPWRYANQKFSVNNFLSSGKKEKIDIWVNKTVFEFNYEYVMSLKLFETKTLVANIIAAILNTRASFSFSFSYETEMIKGLVRQIVEGMAQMDDTEIDDCFYNFDNSSYDELLEQTKQKYDGVYKIAGEEGTVDVGQLSEVINDIDNASTLVEQQTKIENIFKTFIVTPGTEDTEKDNFKFAFGSTVLDKLLKETITQIVLQVLTPKVAILFKINSEIMGNLDFETEDISGNKIKERAFDTWKDFIKKLKNVIKDLVKQIRELILKSLYDFMMYYLKTLLELYALEILKETIRDYRKLIKNILENCSFSLMFNSYRNYNIDNVNYADIVPTQTSPNKDSCG